MGNPVSMAVRLDLIEGFEGDGIQETFSLPGYYRNHSDLRHGQGSNSGQARIAISMRKAVVALWVVKLKSLKREKQDK